MPRKTPQGGSLKKKIAFRVIFCLWGLLFALGLLEALLRLSGYYRCSLDRSFPSIYVSSARYCFKLRPEARFRHCSYYGDYEVIYTINSKGDREVPGSRPDALTARRVALLLGDSFTFGIGVNDDETYAARLQELLTESTEISVVNKAVPGYTIDQQLLALRDSLLEAREGRGSIAFVVLQVFPSNDVIELKNHIGNAEGECVKDSVYKVDDTHRLNARSVHIGLLKRISRRLFLYRFMVEDFSLHMRNLRRLLARELPSKGLSKEEIARRNRLWVRENSSLIDRYISVAAQLFDTAETFRIPVIVLYEAGENGPLDEMVRGYIRARQKVKLLETARFLKKEHYLPRDRHYSPQGHEEIANRLWKILAFRAHGSRRGDPEY
jgi:hypothetical protein